MAFEQKTWYNNGVLPDDAPEDAVAPCLDADNLNRIERGIADAHDDINESCLHKSGGEMTGSLILSKNPEQALEAATKDYVDNFQPPWYVEDENGVEVPLKCLSSESLGQVTASGSESDASLITEEGVLFTAINSGVVWLQFEVYRTYSSSGYVYLYLNNERIRAKSFTNSVSSATTETFKTKLSLNKGDVVSAQCMVRPRSDSSGVTRLRNVYLFANIDTLFCYDLSSNQLESGATLI